MNIESIKKNLTESGIFHSETTILGEKTIIGYEKKFKWTWVATQLNTFIIATDLRDEEITVQIIEKHLSESFKFAKNNYKGWPRGLQS
jgi:replication initiation and membrane attachment protein DnaB